LLLLHFGFQSSNLRFRLVGAPLKRLSPLGIFDLPCRISAQRHRSTSLQSVVLLVIVELFQVSIELQFFLLI